jgi:hypothetical protein
VSVPRAGLFRSLRSPHYRIWAAGTRETIAKLAQALDVPAARLS